MCVQHTPYDYSEVELKSAWRMIKEVQYMAEVLKERPGILNQEMGLM